MFLRKKRKNFFVLQGALKNDKIRALQISGKNSKLLKILSNIFEEVLLQVKSLAVTYLGAIHL